MAEYYVGEIRLFGGNFAPVNWAFCNGAQLNISDYEMLYSLIGTTYGGNGVQTFALPDLRSRVAVGYGAGTGTGLNLALGEMGGYEATTITNANMVPHTHALAVATNTNTPGSQANGYFGPSTGTPGILLYADAATTTAQLAANEVGSTGLSLPLDNRQPSLGLNYIIALNGIYPSFN